MSTLSQLIQNIKKERSAGKILATELQSNKLAAKTVEKNVAIQKRKQKNTSQLDDLKNQLEEEIKNKISEAQVANGNIKNYLDELYKKSPKELIEQLSDDCPFLLFPVKIETKFKTIGGKTELWVRIFPDDIAIHTHEELLTEGEYESGKSYWRAILNITDETIKQGAWNNLVASYDANRSGWIIRQTRPLNWNEFPSNADALQFPEITSFKSGSWTQAPSSKIMPDKFVVSGYSNTELIFEQTGNIIPDGLQMAPDPSSETAQLSRDKTTGEILADEGLAWMFDFKKAEDAGMAMRIPLKEPYASKGFDRLIVLGLRISSSAEESSDLIEELIDNHHYSVDGFSFLKQGTATNNTEDGSSGYDSKDFANETSYEAETGDALFTVTNDDLSKTDGQLFAEYLGINYDPLYHLVNSNLTDIKESQLMNSALWPGTLGYFMNEMMYPVFTDGQIEFTRTFFRQYVSGRGPIPAIRVGNQPYGILPTSNFAAWKWNINETGKNQAHYNQLHSTLFKLQNTWDELTAKVDYAGKLGDPFQILLSIIGLQAGSAEFYQRIGTDDVFTWNYLNYQNHQTAASWNAIFKSYKNSILNKLGLSTETPPKIADISFLGAQNQLTGKLIDDIEELSEESTIASFDGTNNYINWLLLSDSRTILNEEFKDASGNSIDPPKALLYLTLRNAYLQQVWLNVNDLLKQNNLISFSLKEQSIVNVESKASLTKTDYMLMQVNKILPDSITNNSNAFAADFVTKPSVITMIGNSYLTEIKEALGKLATLPSARLERLFTEHLDVCSYRIDAWQTAMFAKRLEYFRSKTKAVGQSVVKGTYIGAFGWLENIKPNNAKKTEVNQNELPEKLRKKEKVYTDSDNGGYIHGFSLNHALTGAVLRNAYLTHANESNADSMSINLSSQRVRGALYYLDGIRNGQTMASLLGYQFERGLHDNYPSLQLDEYIYEIRQKYPLASSELPVSSESDETIAASNVVDGYALWVASKSKAYPYDINNLPASSTSEGKAILEEVEKLAEAMDGIGDLALGESVYQIIQGNYERSGAVLKSFSEGKNPVEPQIVNTPRKGTMITNRITLSLENDPADTIWGVALTARAETEKGLNKWLSALIPDPENIRCAVTASYSDVGSESEITVNDEIKLSELEIQPVDFVLMIDKTFGNGASEIERRIAYTFKKDNHIPDNAVVEILFQERLTDWDDSIKTFFEIMPLVKNLQDVITQRRPLHALDFNLSSEAQSTDSNNIKGWDLNNIKNSASTGRLDKTYTALGELKNKLSTFSITEPYTETLFNDWRFLLKSISDYGIAEAFPNSAIGFTSAEYEILKTQTDLTLTLLEDKLTRAIDLLEYIPSDGILSDNPTEQELMFEASRKNDECISKYSEAAKLLLGSSFTLIPKFSLNNSDEINSAISNSSNLVRYSTVDRNVPFIADEWLQGVAKVRKQSANLEEIIMYERNIYQSEITLTPLQFPYNADDHWVAVEFPSDTKIEEDKLSVAAILPVDYDPFAAQSGFLIDDWTEIIPSGKKETTGIAFHYDQPNAMPPQSLLLAVTPEIKGNWTWKDIMGILNDTLDRAKRRAVEPDHIDDSVYAQFLPAIMSAFSNHPVTISTYFSENITGKTNINPKNYA